MKKRVTTVGCLLMAAMLTACGNGAAAEDGGNDRESASSEASGGASADISSAEWTWPLEEKREIDIWLVWQDDFVESPEDLKGLQAIEEKTNVHVNWIYANKNEAAEKFSLLIASGNYPDIIVDAASYYSGGDVAMCDDEVTYDLTDVIEEYMPNYYSLIASDQNLMRDVVTDDGRFLSVHTLASHFGDLSGERVYGGTCCRKDWLDEMGLEIPETIEDWHETLVKVKEKYPDTIPLMLPSDGADAYNTFLSAYGILSEFYQEDGTVKYGPCEEGYRKWVETMRQWYSEGLIDPNFIAAEATGEIYSPMDYLGSGKAFAGVTLWGYTAGNMRDRGYNEEEDFYLTAVPYPVLKEGDTPQAGLAMSDIAKSSIVITRSAEDLEFTMRYLDYWFSKESMMFDTLGIEGESYADNGDGTYSLTDSLLQLIEDGVVPSKTEAVYTYTLGNYGFGLYDWGRFDAIYGGDENFKSYDIWDTAQYSLMLPTAMTLTAEETAGYSAIYTDILTLVQENTVKFITGTLSMDDYDDFVLQLDTYGIGECIGYKQAALDRYNSRID